MNRAIHGHSRIAAYPGVYLRRLATCATLAAALLAGPAMAQTCAGFTDVAATSTFCPNVDWIRNRAITLGCGGTSYCPDTSVSRLQMAVFLSRLGTALTPVQLLVDTAPGIVDLDANAVICQTGDFAVTGYPRRGFADLAFNARSVADVVLAADLAMTSNGGATWANLNSVTNRGSVIANQWGALADIASADLEVGQTVRFGVRVTRGGVVGATDLSDSRCQVRVLIHSRDGAVSPH